jgi:hypothetical protein
MTDVSLKATAYHEAGHAVVIFRFRAEVSGYIEPMTTRRVCRILRYRIIRISWGACVVPWLIEHPDEETRIVNRSISSAMAGYMAQEIGSLERHI